LTSPPGFRPINLPPLAWGRVPRATTAKSTRVTGGPASRTRQSDRVKGICGSGNKAPIHIDLTEGNDTAGVSTRGGGVRTRGGGVRTRGGTARGTTTRGGATSFARGDVSSSAAQEIGKRVVPTIEKGIEAMEAKRRKTRPEWKH
jgi:hypothetical protein